MHHSDEEAVIGSKIFVCLMKLGQFVEIDPHLHSIFDEALFVKLNAFVMEAAVHSSNCILHLLEEDIYQVDGFVAFLKFEVLPLLI